MITKEKWNEIEAELKTLFGRVEFKLNDLTISIARRSVSEGKTELFVFIDNSIQYSWGHPSGDSFNPLVVTLWRKASAALYTTRQIKQIEKIFGKRQSLKEYPNLRSRFEFYLPTFKTAASVVRQYKRIKGLMLESISDV
ncbi:hypothetical protein [Limnobaculum xujianqingii]|uniref:hypothetical protein n=1 Tax=Limnobaculum xujianqingii TaxID=2738837 RepID=UPI001127B4D1|nr:hypothetical protein [Limnobaculum xujianqingii]